MLNTSRHCRPTLFLGFGGTAGAVLDRIKQRLHRRFAGKQVDAIRFLQTDIDQRALNHLVSLHGPGLAAGETMALPLRRPEYYRTRANGYQKWFSRRWLYNIPRSLTTEGLRPLARLAFVDNAPKLFDRIRSELALLSDPDVLAKASEAANAPFETNCHIVLVASLSGATGGGMVLDAGYAAKQIAKEMNLDQAQICGVMIHAASGDINDRELGVVNAYAALKELLYYRQVQYPGDEDCGLNRAAGDRAAFDDLYFVTNGENQEFTDVVESVSEYLYVDTATEGGSFMDACRRAARRSTDESDESHVQLFGIHREEFLSEWEIDAHVRELSRRVIGWWRGMDEPPPPKSDLLLPQPKPKPNEMAPERKEKLDKLAGDAIGTLQLAHTSLAKHVQEAILAELRTEPEQLIRGLLSNCRESTDSSSAWWTRCQEDLTRLFGEVEDQAASIPLATNLMEQLKRVAQQITARVSHWTQQAFALSSARLGGARYLGGAFLVHVKAFEESESTARRSATDRYRQSVQGVQQILRPSDRRRGPATPGEVNAAIESAAIRRFAVFQHALTRRFAKLIQSLLAKEFEAFLDLEVALKGLEMRIPVNEKIASEGFLAELISDRRMIRIVSDAVMVGQGDEPAQVYASLCKLLRHPEEALHAVGAAAHASLIGATRQLEDSSDAAKNSGQHLKRCLDNAKPVLQDCGGRQRLLVMAPGSMKRGPIRKGIRELLDITPSVVCTGVDFLACYEVEKVSLARIATKLVDGREDFIECAGRVHTRKDIQWDDAFVE